MIPPPRLEAPLIRFRLVNSSGNPVTGIAYNDTNLRIGITRDSSGSIAIYNGQYGGILSATDVGVWSSPGSSVYCRWKEVSPAWFPGLYEAHFDAPFWSQARSCIVLRIWDASAVPRFTEVWETIPVGMPVSIESSILSNARVAAATAILNGEIETGWTLKDTMAVALAALAGKCTITPGPGAGESTVTFRDVNDTANRIQAVTNGDRWRISVSYERP